MSEKWLVATKKHLESPVPIYVKENPRIGLDNVQKGMEEIIKFFTGVEGRAARELLKATGISVEIVENQNRAYVWKDDGLTYYRNEGAFWSGRCNLDIRFEAEDMVRTILVLGWRIEHVLDRMRTQLNRIADEILKNNQLEASHAVAAE